MDPRIVWEWIVSLLTSAGAAALFAWLFKESLGRALDRDLHRDVEHYKSELALQSQQQIERLKSDLQLQTQGQIESIRHEMNKQFLRAQLATTKTQEVYSNLIHLLRKAEGMIAQLWAMFELAQSYDRHSDEDLLAVLEQAKAPGLDKEEVRALIPRDRREAIKKLDALLRQQRRNEAMRAHGEANNHIALESVFMTKKVKTQAAEVIRVLWAAWVDADVGKDAPHGQSKTFFDSFRANTAKVTAMLDQLEDLNARRPLAGDH
jgi:hypothetical protein